MGRVTVPAVSEIATEVETEDGKGRGEKEKGNNCFSHRPKKRVHEPPSFDTKFFRVDSKTRGLSLIVPLFLPLLFFFTPSSVLPFLSPLSRPLACTAILSPSTLPSCRFVSAFCDELIKPDRYYRPEILTRGSRRPEGGKGTIWNVVFMKT